tara:strand:+ start:734 stop:856 length:123 start_codon:yes stop_codon:yes gene_type:complete
MNKEEMIMTIKAVVIVTITVLSLLTVSFAFAGIMYLMGVR